MKIDLQLDKAMSVVYYYINGASVSSSDGLKNILIKYNTGDFVCLKLENNEYRVKHIETCDGLIFDY